MKYNMRPVSDRQIDTLIGISKGIAADGVVNQQEAEFLLDWLKINAAVVLNNPIAKPLMDRISVMLEDEFLDNEEAEELMATLEKFTGGIPAQGEFLKTTSLPLNDPPPPVIFSDRSFLFTGTFAYGDREMCKAAVTTRKGENAANVTRSLDYLVLGQYVTSSWKHENFGKKIEKAMRYRERPGSTLAIVSEEHWRKEGDF